MFLDLVGEGETHLKDILRGQIPFEKCTIIYTYYLTRAAKAPGETIAYTMSGIRPASLSGEWQRKLLLANLSRRLTGELIVYPCSGVRPSVICKDLLL